MPRIALVGCCAAITLSSLVPVASRARSPSATVPEERLLARFAPVVILAPGERAMPANVDWYLARCRIGPEPLDAPRLTQASLSGIGRDGALGSAARGGARLRPSRAARKGSLDPRDWIVYGHLYRGKDGDILLQYWFFYPFNDFHALFDHEGDWEHVTVRVDPALQPRGAWYARHDWSAPGKWFGWAQLEREGDHPVVLSARGSHASYAAAGDVRWYDRACRTRVPSDARTAGCVVWRTWAPPTGGVIDAGTRERPRPSARFVSWPGRWGTLGWFGRNTGGPPGPAFQAGWCSEGASDCS